jgi:hypothetical protein
MGSNGDEASIGVASPHGTGRNLSSPSDEQTKSAMELHIEKSEIWGSSGGLGFPGFPRSIEKKVKVTRSMGSHTGSYHVSVSVQYTTSMAIDGLFDGSEAMYLFTEIHVSCFSAG